MLNKLKSKKTMSAEVVDGHLLLSLLNANEPKIWRMSLDKIGTASFELKKEKNGSITKLIIKPKKGTAEIIAEFNDSETALEALSLSSQAMQSQPTKTTETTQKKPQQANNTSNKWGAVLMGLVIVAGLYYYLTTLIPQRHEGIGNAAQTQSNSSTPAQQKTGVPISADDFLGGQ